jgi:hypothetical protein
MSLTKKEMLQLSYFMARAHVAGQADVSRDLGECN